LIVAALFGWLERKQRDVIEFHRSELRTEDAAARPADAVE
jgi:hypothetical protein